MGQHRTSKIFNFCNEFISTGSCFKFLHSEKIKTSRVLSFPMERGTFSSSLFPVSFKYDRRLRELIHSNNSLMEVAPNRVYDKSNTLRELNLAMSILFSNCNGQLVCTKSDLSLE